MWTELVCTVSTSSVVYYYGRSTTVALPAAVQRHGSRRRPRRAGPAAATTSPISMTMMVMMEVDRAAQSAAAGHTVCPSAFHLVIHTIGTDNPLRNVRYLSANILLVACNVGRRTFAVLRSTCS